MGGNEYCCIALPIACDTPLWPMVENPFVSYGPEVGVCGAYEDPPPDGGQAASYGDPMGGVQPFGKLEKGDLLASWVVKIGRAHV